MARVLVVAEEPVARRLAWVLEQSGHTPATARDTSEALRQAEAEPPDVIVINGVAPSERLDMCAKELVERSPGSQILDISTPAAAPPSKQLASDAQLRKPFDADDFLRAIEQLAERARDC